MWSREHMFDLLCGHSGEKRLESLSPSTRWLRFVLDQSSNVAPGVTTSAYGP